MTIPAPANVVDMVPNQSECSVQSRGKWNGTTRLDKAGLAQRPGVYSCVDSRIAALGIRPVIRSDLDDRRGHGEIAAGGGKVCDGFPNKYKA